MAISYCSLLFSSYSKVKVRLYTSEAMFCLIFVISLMHGFLRFWDVILPEVYFISFFSVFLGFVLATFFSCLPNHKKLKIIDLIINVNGILIITQHVVYFIFKKYLDLHYFISFSASHSRYESGFFQYFGLIRPTSIFVEPSNAAAFLLYFSVLRILISIDTITKSRIIWICIVPALTFSVAGILSSLLAAMSYSIFLLRHSRFFSKLIIFLMLSGIASLAYKFIMFRLGSNIDYDPVAYRSGIIQYIGLVLSELPIFGLGIFFSGEVFQLLDVQLIHSKLRDSGVLPNMLISSGFLGLTALIYHFYVSAKRNWLICLLAATPLLMKIDYAYIIFWFYIFTIRRLS